jgi:glycine hydroxymethyltransferase
MFHENAKSVGKMDPEIQALIEKETRRQEDGLELIASENYTSQAVMEAQGSTLTNKYAEGLPNKRYYGGCEIVDCVETIAIERVKKLFKCGFANVQPHSGSQANMCAYFALLEPGAKILGMNLAEGGHLTHGSPVNFSGRLFNIIPYGLNPETETIDYEKLEEIALKEKPKMIIAGASAYSRTLDFERFRNIADKVNAYLLVDMAHIAGLVAAGVHPSPFPHAHVVTSTTHKTLRGPRGGIVLTNDEELAKKINFHLFPGIQGGPLEHVIAAKAVAFLEALRPEYKNYQFQVIENAKALCVALKILKISIVSEGTDNHLLMIKTDSVGLTGKEAEKTLEKAGITCNKNMIPGDKRSPFVTSGVRIGTPAITTRGLDTTHMQQVAGWINKSLRNHDHPNILEEIKKEVVNLCRDYPVYKN